MKKQPFLIAFHNQCALFQENLWHNEAKCEQLMTSKYRKSIKKYLCLENGYLHFLCVSSMLKAWAGLKSR